MSDFRGSRGEFDWWTSFAKEHELDDVLLNGAAEAEREGELPVAPPGPTLVEATRSWEEVKDVDTGSVTVQYVDGDPEPGTPMREVKVPDGKGNLVPIYVPAEVPPEGIKVVINGIEGFIYKDPGEEEPSGDEEAEVEAHIAEATQIFPRVLGQPAPGFTAYGFALHAVLRDELIEAWTHVEHHNCEAGRKFLDRFLRQLIDVLYLAQREGQ